MKNSCKNYIINQYFEQKEIFTKNDYDVKYIEIGNTNNLSGYILIKQNFESTTVSKKRKKRKSFYTQVVFAGLRQPTKDISISTYSILSMFIKRFKVDDLDICFDGLSELAINEDTLMMYRFLFKDYISSFSDTHREQTSFYINEPSSPLSDTDKFKKILVYDKFLKESRYKDLSKELQNWKRLEVTLKVQFKMKGFILDDYIEDIKRTALKYFNTSSFSYEYLNMQNKLLTDKRTHNNKNIEL